MATRICWSIVVLGFVAACASLYVQRATEATKAACVNVLVTRPKVAAIAIETGTTAQVVARQLCEVPGIIARATDPERLDEVLP